MIFPEVSGQNLEFENFDLPYNLEGELNLLIIPFRRWHQNLVDEWSFYLNSLEKKYSNFRYYEIPTLNRGYKIMRFMIDGGMRAGIPDKAVRERTITIYTNKTLFKKKLKIASEETIYLFLMNKNGEIIWRSQGPFDKNKLQTLEKYLMKRDL
ncbi:MAG: hypothetical protein JSV23_01590 [Promethearchaeota archaeon]|nr:MAG: hypothetical protein JSV23_01590 [Candidatus Lokiarchaeota archaeon]